MSDAVELGKRVLLFPPALPVVGLAEGLRDLEPDEEAVALGEPVTVTLGLAVVLALALVLLLASPVTLTAGAREPAEEMLVLLDWVPDLDKEPVTDDVVAALVLVLRVREHVLLTGSVGVGDADTLPGTNTDTDTVPTAPRQPSTCTTNGNVEGPTSTVTQLYTTLSKQSSLKPTCRGGRWWGGK